MKHIFLLLFFCSASVLFSQAFTWMGGSTVCCSNGFHGTPGTGAQANQPSSTKDAATWTDSQGNLWLFGVQGSELWRYDVNTEFWTWVRGDSSINGMYGNYGIKGVPSVQNSPGKRSWAISWTDSTDCLWLFGGWGQTTKYKSGNTLNDLWKYTPTTNEWCWVSGDSVTGVYDKFGIAGVPSVTNCPGATFGGLGFTDGSSNLYLHGGQGNGIYSCNVWKYNIITQEWTWLNGNQNNYLYGKKGLYHPGHIPPGRYLAAGAMDNNKGEFWLFTGDNIGHVGVIFNDVWKYSIKLNQWAWMGGDSVSIWKDPFYGARHNFYQNSTPGGRWSAVAWADSKGKLFLYGGMSHKGLKSDLWQFDPALKSWAWVGGSDSLYQKGIYGTLGVPGAYNVPSRRAGSAHWIGKADDLWLFGGFNYGLSGDGNWNDLWKISTSLTLTTLEESKLASSEANIFPVPSNGSCTIKSNTPFNRIRISDAQGRFIQEVNFAVHTNEADLDLISWSEGLYFVELQATGASVIRLKQILSKK